MRSEEDIWEDQVLAWARREVGWDEVGNCTWRPVLWCATCHADLAPERVRRAWRLGRPRYVCDCCAGLVRPTPF